jgi:hypothetical protein
MPEPADDPVATARKTGKKEASRLFKRYTALAGMRVPHPSTVTNQRTISPYLAAARDLHAARIGGQQADSSAAIPFALPSQWAGAGSDDVDRPQPLGVSKARSQPASVNRGTRLPARTTTATQPNALGETWLEINAATTIF